ncbi:MAG: hypothetical protein ACE5HG_01545 [Candidatus Bathyarchaeia archaeon]
MEEKVGAHESVKEMYERVHGEELTNVVDCFEAEQRSRCPLFEKNRKEALVEGIK